MNSRRTTLLALVISFNFAEVKGTVFKKLDPNKLSPIVYQACNLLPPRSLPLLCFLP